jgi:tetratricopeptide (TPR) repeat protein
MHRLVGAITLAKLESTDHQTRFNEAVELIHRVYPRLSPTESYLNLHWSKLRLYLPHVLALERQYRESESPLEPTAHFADILVSASWFMFEQNSAELALSVLPTAREVCLATKTGNEFNVASMWRTWACVYLDIGNYQAALDHFTKMLEVLKASFPPEDLTLTMGYNGVGIGNIGLGNYDAAEWNLNKSMEIRDLYPNVNPAMRGLTLANISALNCLRGDFGVALEIAQKALPLIEDNLGAESIKSSEYVTILRSIYSTLTLQGSSPSRQCLQGTWKFG